jgi:hypothetical protein
MNELFSFSSSHPHGICSLRKDKEKCAPGPPGPSDLVPSTNRKEILQRCAQSSGCESPLTNGIRRKERDKNNRPSGCALPLLSQNRKPVKSVRLSGHISFVFLDDTPVHPCGPGFFLVLSVIHYPPYTRQLKKIKETFLPPRTGQEYPDRSRTAFAVIIIIKKLRSLASCQTIPRGESSLHITTRANPKRNTLGGGGGGTLFLCALGVLLSLTS